VRRTQYRTRNTLPLIVVVLVGAFFVACSPVRLYESGRLLVEITERPSAGTGEMQARRSEIVYQGVAGSMPAHLYLPPGAAGTGDADAALLLVPGLAPKGGDDPRFVPFAVALSQAGFAVMVPDIAGFRAQRIGPADIDAIAEALAALADMAATAERPVGIAAISYAVGPALLATMRPQTQGRVDFMFAVGGYHDLTAVLTFFTTGYFRPAPEAPWQRGTPNAYGKWIFVRANLDRIADLRDRTALGAMAERRLGDLEAPIDDLAAGLGPEGRAVHELLRNDDPERVPQLTAALPAGLRTDLAALDLSDRDLSAAPPHILLIHGRDDPVIPASQSAALAAALPAGSAELVIIDSLAHAELGPAGWLDLLRMWRAAYTLLGWRDGS
jgi:pimeloyl-ACP methyl ester carboxylesterase